MQEAGSPKPESLACMRWPSHQISLQSLCQKLPDKTQEDKTQSLPVAPLSLFSSHKPPQRQQVACKALCSPGQTHELWPSKNREVGWRKWSSLSLWLFFHDSIGPPEWAFKLFPESPQTLAPASSGFISYHSTPLHPTVSHTYPLAILVYEPFPDSIHLEYFPHHGETHHTNANWFP